MNLFLIADQSVKDQVSKIAEQMNVRKPRKILIAKGVFNAYIRFRTLVLGELLLNNLITTELECIIAHEQGAKFFTLSVRIHKRIFETCE